MKKILSIYNQQKEVISYLFWGVMTTVVNILIFALFHWLTNWNYLINNSIAWLISVLFAYVTNRIYVFHSYSDSRKAMFKEIISFLIGRGASYFIEQAILIVGISGLKWHEITVKIIANVVVVIINYFWSKWAVFKKKGTES
ncbi:GtrA family protein [Lentilactobacillus kosonis]|uniref:Teichoic acid glycosylation protein n=1 Tax=Lentilactobacillus kosonis TaxID=2810561 RepID=A0A401FPT9_9LACO|nr:GtrA family protein [Lentilactobacillus kosonis]GAY74405.1 teichoic acid glycosylation protein [Lentilactobacillus kosonis]